MMHEEIYIEQSIEEEFAALLRKEMQKELTHLSKWGLSEHDKNLLNNFENHEKTS